jgi:hypothetical protein
VAVAVAATAATALHLMARGEGSFETSMLVMMAW